MTAFLRTWLAGYRSPARVAEALKGAPAPHWGLYAVLIRGLCDSLLLYLPLALLGSAPSTPSALAFLPTARYYGASVLFMPIFFLAQWLLVGGAVHLALRLAGHRSDLDQILNVNGMAALVIGAFLVVWDWGYVLLGGHSDVLLGISHMVVDGWAIAISALGLRQTLGVRLRLGIALSVLGIIVGVLPAIVFVRAPV